MSNPNPNKPQSNPNDDIQFLIINDAGEVRGFKSDPELEEAVRKHLAEGHTGGHWRVFKLDSDIGFKDGDARWDSLKLK